MAVKRSAQPTADRWQGTIRIGLGYGLFDGLAADNSPHAHHAIQLVLPEHTARIWVAAADWQALPGAVVGANVSHCLAPSADAVRLIYVEPNSLTGRALAATLVDGWRALTAVDVQRIRREIDGQTSESLLAKLSAAIGLDAPDSAAFDAVMSKILDSLPHPLPERVSAAALAAQAQLSLSRFQHRFHDHTGMAFRPYLRWLRLLTAMQYIAGGGAITPAAMEAGFSDVAHLSRTVRRHFGIRPSALLDIGIR